MKKWKSLFWVCSACLALAGVVNVVSPGAIAQVRAALVRDVDNPALQPFRGNLGYTLNSINQQALVTTVPAGKRLVIEHISWIGTGSPGSGTQIIFGSLRTSEFGAIVEHLQINPPHLSATSSLSLQDGSQSGPVYFEPGEEVWLSVSKSNGGFADIRVNLYGYYITL